MDRRTFLLAALGGALAVGAAGGAVFEGPKLLNDSGPAPRRYGKTILRQRKAKSDAPNILMLGMDDCNDWVGFLNNHPGTKTPNLDALAARSLVFTSAYCAAPMCLPARTA